MERSRIRQVLRLLTLVVFSAAIAVASTFGIMMWQDSYRQRELAAGASDFEPLGPENPPSPESFHPTQVVPSFPPISKFPVVSAEKAKDEIDDAELVLGVTVKGSARAYPINMLTGPSREILNDTLGGRAIAATW